MLIFLQFSVGTRAVVTSSRHRPFCFHNFVFLLNCLFVLYRISVCVTAVSKSHEFLSKVRRLSSFFSTTTTTPTPSRRRVVIFSTTTQGIRLRRWVDVFSTTSDTTIHPKSVQYTPLCWCESLTWRRAVDDRIWNQSVHWRSCCMQGAVYCRRSSALNTTSWR